MQHFFPIDCDVDNGQNIQKRTSLSVGQERFRSMAPMYYRGSKAAVLVFDVTSRDSFTSLKQWMKELSAHSEPDLITVVAANKCDLTPSFDLLECEEYAYSIGAKFFKTSSVTGEGVELLFEGLVTTIVGQHATRERSLSTDADALNLGARSYSESKGGCC